MDTKKVKYTHRIEAPETRTVEYIKHPSQEPATRQIRVTILEEEAPEDATGREKT